MGLELTSRLSKTQKNQRGAPSHFRRTFAARGASRARVSALTRAGFEYPRHAMATEGKGALISVIGDEDTVTGFLLAGVGEVDVRRRTNYLVQFGSGQRGALADNTTKRSAYGTAGGVLNCEVSTTARHTACCADAHA